MIHVALFPGGGGGESPYGLTVVDALMEYVGWRSAVVASRYVGVGISGGVERNQAFARHGIHRCKRRSAVGGVCGIVRSVPTGQPTAAEPTRG